MATVVEKQAKRWTYEEYYRLDDDQRHEIIDGKLLMTPAPDTWHQDWSREISMLAMPPTNRSRSLRSGTAATTCTAPRRSRASSLLYCCRVSNSI